jgi:hypothetical protein
MGNTTSYSRRQRRLELRRANFLKIKNMYGPLSVQGQAWYAKMREDGKAVHEAHTKMVTDNREEALQTKLNGLSETWTSMGYNEAEVEMLSEAWMMIVVLDPDRVQARKDKKAARKLRAQAHQSLLDRKAA